MKAKEFVLKKYPSAVVRIEKWGKIKGQKETRYYIRDNEGNIIIASGKTESNAWANAKNDILEDEKSEKMAKFMDKNGLGFEDMSNDITYPPIEM